ncbi:MULTISPECIES: erythromycin esterase family protein [Lysinibacillus]|jgi:erythromycin esterase|uniref:Putative exported hydrolase n=1 Tax=Lysinibacillus capsici TaxID=2115968 RepID=A0A2X0XF31_9BACI|nr:erythromycin esterase family protein [Lysinibacillus capsici]MCT1540083.1 erythromycin esterase family protein [Lysinibacillus capsici]MCT1571027.1 erythromycin esterase family protein [Lysinibacillus capsici]MCT1648556.1 erythromycin esterase family protein [Lysinibacillus capsici]MCT1727098.1 erythromycin esterase family protein [Lysinibacillus capsici]MCT1784371.1 erythromycin esterase family protein [Lysinibacillus capsici]
MRKARKHKVLLSFALASLMTVSGVVNVSAAVPVNEQIIKNDSAVKQARTSNETLLDWKKWANDHAYSLSSIQPETFDGQKIPANKFDDLEMLKPLLHDKRIVFLGESSHGVAQFNLAKTRLIQFLHQDMGYNVLAFESGMGNVMNAQGQIDKQAALQTMKDAIFGVWWTKETLPLFDYAKSTQATEQPLVLTGFDIQQQGAFTNGDWLQNPKLAQQFNEAEKQLAEWSSGKDLKGYQKVKATIIDVYKQVQSQIQFKEKELQAAYPKEPHIVKLMDRTLADRIRLADEYIELTIQSNIDIEQNNIESFLQTMEWRDQAMMENLLWLAEEVYPTEKFIVWAHNDHIRKAQSDVMGSPYPVKLMGERLPDIYKKYSYVLGLYMTSGETANNMGEPMPVLPPVKGSIEDILSSTNKPYTFIDLRNRQNERGNSWMFEPRLSYSWGMIQESLVPREQYDGILLIDQVNKPTYIK